MPINCCFHCSINNSSEQIKASRTMWAPRQTHSWEATPQNVSHYPLYKPLNNNVTYEEKVTYEENHGPHYQHHHNHHPHFEDKVEVIEYEEVVEDGRNGNCRDKVEVVEYERVDRHRNGNHEVYQERVDIESDGYIQQKHKNFELSKWASYRVH